MGYCLWLSGKKVGAVDEITAAFDLSALKSYYYGGSLVSWLKAHGGEKIAKTLESVDNPTPHDIEKILCSSFGFSPPPETRPKTRAAPVKTATHSHNLTSRFPSSFHITSFPSSGIGSGSFSSRHAFEFFSFFSYLFGSGSYNSSSFSHNSLFMNTVYSLNLLGYGIHLI
ncbi:MAG: hypothetical protein FWH05_03640 [Oscillospiraceae bacterium]|nr:hypothetical protein [Oscillospiraceae bacterium]